MAFRSAIRNLVALAVVAAACGSTSHPAASPSSTYQRLVAAYVLYAGCARSHGLPTLSDPQVDAHGDAHYPGSPVFPQTVRDACASTWDRVHAIRDQYDSEQPQPQYPSVEHERAVARCVRAHGFPTFPDPDASGYEPIDKLPPGFTKPNLSPRARVVLQACDPVS
jgi:hypothetical protein